MLQKLAEEGLDGKQGWKVIRWTWKNGRDGNTGSRKGTFIVNLGTSGNDSSTGNSYRKRNK